jgi:hypothetical protein
MVLPVTMRAVSIACCAPREFRWGGAEMSRATIPVQLPPSLGNAARKLAEEDGVSLNQWVSVAVAQKISSVETAEAFFKRRSQGAEQVDFLEILRNAPDRARDPGDELASANVL